MDNNDIIYTTTNNAHKTKPTILFKRKYTTKYRNKLMQIFLNLVSSSLLNEWTVPQLSIMIIYITVQGLFQWIRIILSGDNLNK